MTADARAQAVTAAQARRDAAQAAARASVDIRELSTAEVADAAALLQGIWGSAVVEPPLMVALRHAGAYVVGAFADGRLVGVCVGYFSRPLGEALHSHVAGVASDTGRRGIGMALKLDQRAWALERGLARITWTFDPLVARNAAFNLTRLRADVPEYLVDFYGEMTDGVNAGQGSDRLLASWDLARPLDAPRAQASPTDGDGDADPARASAVLTSDGNGAPQLHMPKLGASLLTVAIPPDIEGLRIQDPTLAARWRGAVRGALAPLIDQGRAVVGFDDNRYLLEAP